MAHDALLVTHGTLPGEMQKSHGYPTAILIMDTKRPVTPLTSQKKIRLRVSEREVCSQETDSIGASS